MLEQVVTDFSVQAPPKPLRFPERFMRDDFLACQDLFHRFPGFDHALGGLFPERLASRFGFHMYGVRR